MAEFWEPVRDRGNDTNAVWNQWDPGFTVGTLTLGAHQADVDLFEPTVQARDDGEDEYDQAVDARDANWKLLHDLNVNAVRVIRGNLEREHPLSLELGDVSGMLNEGSGKIMARARKLSTLWKKVNTARAAALPALAAIEVGGKVVADVDTALGENEPLLKAVAEKLSAWTAARRELKKLSDRVDENNKRWFDAWQGNFPAGTDEGEALNQINTGSGGPPLPGEVTFTLIYDGSGNLHIDASADHATQFRLLRKGPGEDVFIERADHKVSPIDDPVVLPGTYKVKLVAQNSTGDGPESAEQSVVVPA